MNKQKHNKNANRRLSRTVGAKWANRVGITEMSFRTRPFLRRNFPAQQRENGENPPPRFWFILFAIFFLFLSFLLLFLWGLAGWCAYTKSIHWCSPYRYPHSPTSPHPHPHSAETLLWRVSICLCLSNGNWHKGPQTRQHLISRAK